MAFTRNDITGGVAVAGTYYYSRLSLTPEKPEPISVRLLSFYFYGYSWFLISF